MQAYSENQGLPTFGLSIEGITDSTPYFYLDFSNSNTVAWGSGCTYTDIGVYEAGDCSQKPTYMEMGFNGTEAGLPIFFGSFSDRSFGGFNVSGTRYLSKMCFGSDSCVSHYIYSGDLITADSWLYGESAAYGILGLGPYSTLWEGFVDPVTLVATYTVSVVRKVG